jgi:hypothetical protein
MNTFTNVLTAICSGLGILFGLGVAVYDLILIFNKPKKQTMKTKIILTISALALIATSFKLAIDKTAATVDMQEGVSIFILSKPKQNFDYLGTVKIKMTWSGAPDELLKKAIKKVKSEYPQADGIVFANIDLDKADAVKFKE